MEDNVAYYHPKHILWFLHILKKKENQNGVLQMKKYENNSMFICGNIFGSS